MNNSKGLLFSDDNKLNAIKKIIIFYKDNVRDLCFGDMMYEMYNILLVIDPDTLKNFIANENNDLEVGETLLQILNYVREDIIRNNINIGIDIDDLISYISVSMNRSYIITYDPMWDMGPCEDGLYSTRNEEIILFFR